MGLFTKRSKTEKTVTTAPMTTTPAYAPAVLDVDRYAADKLADLQRNLAPNGYPLIPGYLRTNEAAAIKAAITEIYLAGHAAGRQFRGATH